MVAEDIEPETRPVDVIQVVPGGNLQWVALQCEMVPDSTPTPAIQWRRRPVGSDPEMVPGDILAEDFTSNTIHFVDGGKWLILETDESAITDLEYFCEVTNKRRFQTVRGPLTYTLNPGGPLSLLHITKLTDLFEIFLSKKNTIKELNTLIVFLAKLAHQQVCCCAISTFLYCAIIIIYFPLVYIQ